MSTVRRVKRANEDYWSRLVNGPKVFTRIIGLLLSFFLHPSISKHPHFVSVYHNGGSANHSDHSPDAIASHTATSERQYLLESSAYGSKTSFPAWANRLALRHPTTGSLRAKQIQFQPYRKPSLPLSSYQLHREIPGLTVRLPNRPSSRDNRHDSSWKLCIYKKVHGLKLRATHAKVTACYGTAAYSISIVQQGQVRRRFKPKKKQEKSTAVQPATTT
jgi:hypothetical protein